MSHPFIRLHFVFMASLPFFLLQTEGGGFEGHLCPPERAKHSCQEGCFRDHGAGYGFCLNNTEFPNDFNCYCGPLVLRDTPNTLSGQCVDPLNLKYDKACRLTCQCTHGTLEGHCDYKRRSCDCISQNPRSNQERNGICPFRSVDDMLVYLRSLNLPDWPRD